ncbi:MAG: GFA family protein [Hyphomicrobiales bacterium]|uniref:GFA family protein n=1 Tax=Aestuariivirga sp. TaxID=2650926 RepID=UPI0035AE8CF8
MKTGSCLCGAVRFEVHGALRPVLACHCIQCRKQTGNYLSSTACADSELKFTSESSLKWFRSSDIAQRGFCGDCGSVLFWKRDGSADTSIAAGAIDGATGTYLEGHIYCESAGDYYAIAGGAYRKDEW